MGVVSRAEREAGKSFLQRCSCVDLLLQRLCCLETQQRCLAAKLSRTQKAAQPFTLPRTCVLKPLCLGEVQGRQFWGAAEISCVLQRNKKEGGKQLLLPRVRLATSFHHFMGKYEHQVIYWVFQVTAAKGEAVLDLHGQRWSLLSSLGLITVLMSPLHPSKLVLLLAEVSLG